MVFIEKNSIFPQGESQVVKLIFFSMEDVKFNIVKRFCALNSANLNILLRCYQLGTNFCGKYLIHISSMRLPLPHPFKHETRVEWGTLLLGPCQSRAVAYIRPWGLLALQERSEPGNAPWLKRLMGPRQALQCQLIQLALQTVRLFLFPKIMFLNYKLSIDTISV